RVCKVASHRRCPPFSRVYNSPSARDRASSVQGTIMRTGMSRRVAAAALCMLLAASGTEAAPSDTAIDALRDISLRIQTATRETVEAHTAHRGADAATVQAMKSLRGRFDAIARRASVDGYA